MSFDFPNSPTEGQIFNAPSGPTYVFNTPAWRAVGQGQIAVISDNAPSNPANGQLWLESDTGLLFVYWNDGNSSQWVQVGGNAATGAINTVTFLASGTYTAPAGLRYLEVSCYGGGGAGGGPQATVAGQAAAGSGGNGGAFAWSLLDAATVGASQTVTVGAGGVGVAGGGGNAGGNSSFGALVVAAGGNGGAAGGAGVPPTTTAPNVSTQSTAGQVRGWTVVGSNGQTSTPSSGNRAGVGGNTVWGGAGTALVNAGQPNTGSGGGGSQLNASSAAIAGGTGGSGIVVLKEIF